MAYPPEFSSTLTYANELNLDSIPVFMERSGDNPMFLEIHMLPNVLTYGKHYGFFSLKDPSQLPTGQCYCECHDIDNPQYLLAVDDPFLGQCSNDGECTTACMDFCSSQGNYEINFSECYQQDSENQMSNNNHYKLKDNSKIQFEVKDVDGRLIYSDLASSEDTADNYSGTGAFYIWIKEDPLRTYEDIKNGIGTITVVGELEGVPEKWVGKTNYRCTFPIEIRTDLPNTSPIFFQSASLVNSSLVLSESRESDNTDTNFMRNYLNVSASNLLTFGGKVEFIEISYKEQRSLTDEFKVLNTYPLSSSIFEVTASSATGLNPMSDHQKFPIPTEIRRFGNVEYRLRFLTKNAEYAQNLADNGKFIEASSSLITTGSTINIDTGDGIFVTGSGGIFFGRDESNGIRIDFSPSGKGVHTDSSNIEFKPIANGTEGKSFIIDDKGRSINSGDSNKISDTDEGGGVNSAQFSSIIGAEDSFISGSSRAAIIGGQTNKIVTSTHTVIVGGQNNLIFSPSDAGESTLPFTNTIVGGANSEISQSLGINNTNPMWFNTIVGGQYNNIYGYKQFAGNVVVGGVVNWIRNVSGSTSDGPYYSAIIGGSNNQVNHDRSVIIGMASKTTDADNTVYVQNLDVAGNMNVNVLTASIITSSTVQTEGSNIFGDSNADTQTFNGNVAIMGAGDSYVSHSINGLTIAGDISASGDFYSETTTSFNTPISVPSLYASQIISTSKILIGNQGAYMQSDNVHVHSSGDAVFLYAGNAAVADAQPYITSEGGFTFMLDSDNNQSDTFFSIRKDQAIPSLGTEIFKIDDAGDIDLVNQITASGNISSSGTLIGGGLDINGTTTFNDGHITNVGNIDVDVIRGDGANDVNLSLGTAGITFKAEDGDKFSFNEGENNVDLLYLNSDENNFVFFDASTSKVGIGDGISQTPAKTLTIKGEISSSEALFVQGTDLDFSVSASSDTLIIIDGDVSSSGDWYGNGEGIKVSGSTDETTLLTVTHPQTGSLLEVKATADSGSVLISGSILIKNNDLQPADSSSRIFNSGSDLYFGQNAGTSAFPIGPKTLQTYSHNFSDDPSTTEHAVGWPDSFENAAQSDESVAFLCTSQTDVKHVLMRGQGFDQNLGGTITWRIKTHSPYGLTAVTEGNWTTKETTVVTIPSSVDTGATNLIYAIFSGSHGQPGDLLNITFQFSADFANGFDEFYVSSTVEHDYSTLPNLGFSTGSMPTGSDGFGV